MVSPNDIQTVADSKGEVIMSVRGDVQGSEPLAYDELGCVRVNIFFPDYNIQKCFTFDPDENVWEAKKLVLAEVGDQLHDALNYGLFLPPFGGRAGKFLDEERPLDDYKLPGPIGTLEFKYKRRIYRELGINYKRLRTLHNKNTLKHFYDVVKSNSVEKVGKYLERGIDPNFIDADSGETPLTVATKVTRCRNLLLQLVSGGAHIDYRNDKSFTPVHTAAIHGNAEAVKTLLELGASPNYRDDKGLTPLYHLSKKRNSPVLCAELLLRDYSIIGCKDESGSTELHQACKVGNYKVVEMLIFYGADVDYQSLSGATPLHVCASNNEISCLQTLLLRGADKLVLNMARQTPFDVANISGHKEAANILEKHDELLVAPFKDSPTYNTSRRLAGVNLEAMRLLSKSDPRINLSSSVMNLSSFDNFSKTDSLVKSDLGHLGLFDSLSLSRAIIRRSLSLRQNSAVPLSSIPNSLPGRIFVCSRDFVGTLAGELSLKKGDFVTVLSVGDDGIWEGKSGDKEGWFPAEHVAEVKRQTFAQRSASEDINNKGQQSYNTTFPHNFASNRSEGTRTVTLAKTKKGYGFVLRGAKAEQLKRLNVEFVPTERMPALQYLDSVEKGSASDKAGLKAGDFILEIDGVNVIHASHEQTVEIIKKAGDVLSMRVVRAALPRENGVSSNAGYIDGTQTLPNRKSRSTEEPNKESKPKQKIDVHETQEDEVQALEQLDATLAHYDSDSRSSSSGAHVTMREQKVASIRARPTSSHFNSIQELDDMFNPPTSSPPVVPNINQVSILDKDETRKPAKSRVKKFWSKGKSKTLSDKKSLSLSQPNLAAFDTNGDTRPISIEEMALGHSFDVESTTLPRNPSFDPINRRKSQPDIFTSPTSPIPPPPPVYPAPVAPEDISIGGPESSFRPGMVAQMNRPSSDLPLQTSNESTRFLPRTPLPKPSSVSDTNSSLSSSSASTFSSHGGTLQRGKVPPPPPARISSHESGVLLAMQGTRTQSMVEQHHSLKPSDPEPPSSSSAFADAIKKAAASREKQTTNGAINDSDVYASIQKPQSQQTPVNRVTPVISREDTTPPIDTKDGGTSVEDQLRMAVAKRRTLLERRDTNTTTDSERSSSVTPENTLVHAKPAPSKVASETNFRELAEQKRLEFIKRKSELSSEAIRSALPTAVNNQTSGVSNELQQMMNRLAVSKGDEQNNNENLKKKPPPPLMKKPKVTTPTATHQQFIVPATDFPPPPPPLDFGTISTDIIIPPPSFDENGGLSFSPSPISPPLISPKPEQIRNDSDNHSIGSSAGSDTVSSVSQEGKGYSANTSSGYGSDPNKSARPPFEGKSVYTWTADEVGDWLVSIGLGEYRQAFIDNCIEGETLISMSKDDIKDLGVDKVGHKVKLDKEIRKLSPDSHA